MADPVAWTLIEHGWSVCDSTGQEIGKVGELTGDENHDIFDGLTIHTGVLGGTKYVPSERVKQIREGVVVIDVPLASLEDFEKPAVEEQILPEGSTWYQRLAWWLTGRDR
jgi:sporulation protein YlmC with PRC-barrel domain